MVSTLDVIDNYLTSMEATDFASISGRDLDRFGGRVREFAEAHEPEIKAEEHPIYLGGWPSANFAHVGGDLVLSSLLYSGQVLVRDPIADWFSNEQYQLEHMLSASPGYRPPEEDRETSTRRTRAFLAAIVPDLVQMKPLIDAGIVVPVPTESLFLREKKRTEDLRTRLRAKLLGDPMAYAERFRADEIAGENNRRGFFALAPGPDQSSQTRRAIDHGLRYFAREYVLAAAHGVTYTAPFSHERHLCAEGISALASPSSRVVEAVMKSELPVFRGLTPKLLRDVHQDDAFAGFRGQLHQIYSQIPMDDSDEAARYLSDQEDALLRPLIDEGERLATAGVLGRLGASLSSNKFGIVSGLSVDFFVGTSGLATLVATAGTVLDEFAGARSRVTGPERIWSALVRHGKSARDEMRAVRSQPAPSEGAGWGISTEPGMTVSITAGSMLHGPAVGAGQPERLTRLGTYDPCGCGSGQKYKFCCAGLA